MALQIASYTLILLETFIYVVHRRVTGFFAVLSDTGAGDADGEAGSYLEKPKWTLTEKHGAF